MLWRSTFSKKDVYKRAKHGFTIKTWAEKTVHVVETHWLIGKEKVLGITVHKEGHVDSLMKYKKPH